MIGIQLGGINWRRACLGVYLDDAATSWCSSFLGAVTRLVPGCVPFGVTRPPPDFRFGGAIAEERTPIQRVRLTVVVQPSSARALTDGSQVRESTVGTPRRGARLSAMRVLVIDSYDSFVYNLVQYLGELGAEPVVVRNDELTVDEALALQPDGVLLSPGPGRPETSGIICDAIGAFAAASTPVFGVCLGHQAIGHVYGADVVGAPQLMHGKTSPVEHEGLGVFAGLPSPLTATRYHSLTLAPESIPDVLQVTARSTDGVVMGVRHRELDVEGVQFHPESILTASGHDLLRTWLDRVGAAPPIR